MAVFSVNDQCPKRSVSDGLAAVSKALAHKEAELAGAAGMTRTSCANSNILAGELGATAVFDGEV
jgi:hypothetical protein